MPLFGPPNIEKLKAKRDVNALIKALDQPEAISQDAARALSEIRYAPEMLSMPYPAAKSLVTKLLALIEKENAEIFIPSLSAQQSSQFYHNIFMEKVRAELKNKAFKSTYAMALGALGAAAVPPLIDILQHPSEKLTLFYAAVEALGQIGRPALEPLRGLLYDSNPEIAAGAWEAWLKTDDLETLFPTVHGLAYDETHRPTVFKMLACGGPTAVRPLLAFVMVGAMENKESLTVDACQAIRSIGEDAVWPMIAALATPILRPAAEIALQTMGTPPDMVTLSILSGQKVIPAPVQPLIQALENPATREGAISVLTKIGTPEALAAVQKWTAPPQF